MRQTIYKLRIPDDVAELIRNMHPHLKRKIRASLQVILADTNSGKSLKDELKGLRSFCVSRFRNIYRISSEKQIEIVAIGPRERIYGETFRLLSKEGR